MRPGRGQRWFLGAMVLLLALDGAVYFGVVAPRRSRRLDEQVAAMLEPQVEQAAQEVARLERIERDLPATMQQLDRFLNQHFLAEEAGFSAIVDELEGAGDHSGVEPGRVDFRPYGVRDRPELVRIEITTTVEGGYRNLLRFLEALERSGNVYLLERLGLASTIGQGKLKLDLTLETYLRRGRG